MGDHLDAQFAPTVGLMAAAMPPLTAHRCAHLRQRLPPPRAAGQEAATLDVLSGGRLELGIGAGWMTTDHEQAGIPSTPPACASTAWLRP